MNAFFGHGMASMFFLAMLWAWMEQKFRWVGLLYGFTLLTDFAGAAALVTLIPFIIFENYKNPRNIADLIIGGILPAILWCWYHISAYGSPFLTSVQFPRPEFVYDKSVEGQVAGGMFTYLPRWDVVGELIYGRMRGILVTQPWVLVVIIWAVIKKFDKKFYASYAIATLVMLVWLNSTFWGWHAGGSTGPRYLSIGLALMPALGFLIYDKLSNWQKQILWITVGITLLFRAQTYATYILAGKVNLWSWQWESILNSNKFTNWFRLILSLGFFIGAGIYSYRKNHFVRRESEVL